LFYTAGEVAPFNDNCQSSNVSWLSDADFRDELPDHGDERMSAMKRSLVGLLFKILRPAVDPPGLRDRKKAS
jgi:hypothetical protein